MSKPFWLKHPTHGHVLCDENTVGDRLDQGWEKSDAPAAAEPADEDGDDAGAPKGKGKGKGKDKGKAE